MIYIVLGLIGAVAGSVYLYGRGGFLLGGAIGLLAAAAINQRNRMMALEKRLKTIETQAGQAPSKNSSSRTRRRRPLLGRAKPTWTVGRTCPCRRQPPRKRPNRRLPRRCRRRRSPRWISSCPMQPWPRWKALKNPLRQVHRRNDPVDGGIPLKRSSSAATSWCGSGWWCCCSDSPSW